MLFWIIAAVMTAVVTLAALWPLFKTVSVDTSPRADHDVEVYAAQLRELDADLERGIIAPGEIATARAEIGRRLLRAADRSKSTDPALGAGWQRLAIRVSIVTVAIAVPIVSAALYTTVGAGGLADEPLSARRAMAGVDASVGQLAEDKKIGTLIADAEARLKQNPKDGRGWDVLAPIYLRMDRNDDAVNAFRKAITLLGATASREGGLGEALTQAAGGEVTDKARDAFQRSLKINDTYLPARFFLALDLSQEQKSAQAEKAWSRLIEMSPDNAPWLQIANAALADAKQKLVQGLDVASGKAPGSSPGGARQPNGSGGGNAGQPGPSVEDVAAASKMQAGDRQAMIEGMVSQLAARLKTNPDDVEGWKRLIRSFKVLDKPAEAGDAFKTALRTFDANSAAGREIAAFGTEMGLSAGEGTTTR